MSVIVGPGPLLLTLLFVVLIASAAADQEKAIASLDDFGNRADALKDLALLVVNRAK